eukprot:TRINITY_DN11214_c1_g1_i1.p1 TRINITY_DN11214_c1_g1~~TRINITY_DN11214_c1_g1_i1.p1  ORF type:complete len:516 (-),score=72.87 TRINITY_DN11214_c1_g1_i1:250-1797(-)
MTDFAAQTTYMGDESSHSGDQSDLTTHVTSNMDTLPQLREGLLQQVADTMQGDRVDLIARIQGRLDKVRNSLDENGHYDFVSVIREIPLEVIASFRSSSAVVAQNIMAEVQTMSDDMNGKMLARQGFLRNKHVGALTSPSLDARSSVVRSKLGACLAEAHVAMSGHVELFANALLNTCVSERDRSDVAMNISEEAQQILLAKVAAATQECLEDVHRMSEDTSCSLHKSTSVPSANMIQVDQNDLTGIGEDSFDKAYKLDEVESVSDLTQEATAEYLLQSEVCVSYPDHDEVCSVSRVPAPANTLPEDRQWYVASPSVFPGMTTSVDLESHAASQGALHMSADAVDRGRLPGSLGHPELCSRPCVFAAAGLCELGSSCAFCHMPHEKTGVHLDRKRREALKKMTYEERVATILPLVRVKLVELQLDPDLLQDISDILNALTPLTKDSEVARNMRKIQRAQVTKFSLRTLFAMMKADGTEAVSRASVDHLFDKIKAAIVRRSSVPSSAYLYSPCERQ